MSIFQFKRRDARPSLLRRGFTLVEVMIAIAVIGILAAIAVPAYSEYIIRSRCNEAFAALGTIGSTAEGFWSNSNNRTYVGLQASNRWPANSVNFVYSLEFADASRFTVRATGVAGTPVENFAFEIDENGARRTVSVKAGWNGAGSNCWVYKRDGACVQ